jgi:hypothetical protein
MDLTQGTVVIDEFNVSWTVAGMDGSYVELIGPRHGRVKFHQQVRFIAGNWRLTDDDGNMA